MSQDIVADGLNQIMNCKRIEKRELTLKRYSKVLINLLEMMKVEGHLDYTLDKEEKKLSIRLIKLNECRAIKPRYYVGYADIEKYLRRFLPSRNFGTLVISTNNGLMKHKEAFDNKLGGAIIAYFY
jgi:ribosomal protein S8